MITLEVSGVRYDGFTEISVLRNIETISGSFSFSATSNNIIVFPIKAGESCRVYINNTMVINGYIDAVSVSYDSGSHAISLTGRDRTADLVDSTIIGVKEFQGMGLIPIIEKVLLDHGLSDIKVINKAGDVTAEFPDNEPSSSPVSQTLFAFIETYARKRQVLLTTDGLGNVVLARAATALSPISLENTVNNNNNNIKSATVKYDFSRRFNKYILQSQQNPSGSDVSFSGDDDAEIESDDEPDADNELAQVAVQTGTATDGQIRASRVTEIISKTSDVNVNLSQLAEWTKNLARARSIDYEVVVRGWHQDLQETMLWEPNILVKVVDSFSDINATLLIKSVEYKLSVQSGSTTNICLVDSDSYTLQLAVESETEKKKKRSNNVGGNVTFTPPVGQ